ncbi:MAG: hypothetical protein RR623_08650 [Bacilli bacterium]
MNTFFLITNKEDNEENSILEVYTNAQFVVWEINPSYFLAYDLISDINEELGEEEFNEQIKDFLIDGILPDESIFSFLEQVLEIDELKSIFFNLNEYQRFGSFNESGSNIAVLFDRLKQNQDITIKALGKYMNIEDCRNYLSETSENNR